MAFRSLWSDIRNAAHFLADRAVYHVTGYGHRPVNALLYILALWLLAGWIAGATWTAGAFAPNSDVIVSSQVWTDIMAMDCIGPLLAPVPEGQGPCIQNPADFWSARAAPGMDWESFSPWGYALDLVVPVLDIGQTDAWAPSKDRGAWGKSLWWGRWALQVAGWIVTALGAAAITGIIQRGRE